MFVYDGSVQTLMSVNMSFAGGPLNITVVMLSEGSFRSIMVSD